MYICFIILICVVCYCVCFKQKTAYELRISDWSSDVCSSDPLLRDRTADPSTARFDLRGGFVARYRQGSGDDEAFAAQRTVNRNTARCVCAKQTELPHLLFQRKIGRAHV